MLGTLIGAVERGFVPDPAVRYGIRRLCRARLEALAASPEAAAARYAAALRRLPLAVNTDDANRQHYEVPAPFFQLVLGRNLKYSSAFWGPDCRTLDAAEDAALRETAARAELADGQNVLELGCGWGSLTLHMARTLPNARVTAISNSASQRAFIEGRAAAEGLRNVRVLTRNIVDVESVEGAPFDRVVSVEMFEHLRNYETLFERIARWLAPEGKLFVHVFTHREHSYPFETDGDDNWMGRHFFTGGQMPGHGLLPQFQERLALEADWIWDGTHYARTAEAWLENMDRRRADVLAELEKVYGAAGKTVWFNRWRVFFMACAELFAYDGGREWGVSHYRFKNRPR